MWALSSCGTSESSLFLILALSACGFLHQALGDTESKPCGVEVCDTLNHRLHQSSQGKLMSYKEFVSRGIESYRQQGDLLSLAVGFIINLTIKANEVASLRNKNRPNYGFFLLFL